MVLPAESRSASSQLHHEDPRTLAGKWNKTVLGRMAQMFLGRMSPIFKKSTPPQSHRADTQPPILAGEYKQVFLFFCHAYSPVMYTLYKIDIERFLPRPPTKAAQELEIRNPSPLFPILQFKTGEYPEQMCCVQLGSNLYFLGGEFYINNPYIDENVRMELKSVKRDVFPREVYYFNLADRKYSRSLLFPAKPMNSGKASPQAFVADEKIYVVGSSIETNISDRSELKHLDLKSFAYFEVYDPVAVKWKVLPDPPIRNVNTRWVGHAVVGRNALLVAWQQGKERIHCFDLDTHQWTKYVSLPSYPGSFSGRAEFVEDTLYGCYENTVAAIAPLAEEEEEIEEEEELEEEEETEEKGETEELQQAKSLFKHATLLKHHRLHLVSEEMGMDAIFNVPPQLQSSSSLLHLGSRYFCYVKTGMPPHPIHGNDHAILDDKRRFISIVIFQALRETYKQDSTRLFRAKFLHSAHYVVDTLFPSEGFIDGCFSLGLVYLSCLVFFSPFIFPVFIYPLTISLVVSWKLA